jgi:hypothetical protein
LISPFRINFRKKVYVYSPIQKDWVEIKILNYAKSYVIADKKSIYIDAIVPSENGVYIFTKKYVYDEAGKNLTEKKYWFSYNLKHPEIPLELVSIFK